MYVVFLAGGIASGKSSAARLLEDAGCVRIDLDQISRTVLESGGPCLDALAQAFGGDIVDARTGALDRALLAARAFATPENAALLERIEIPFIVEHLRAQLDSLKDRKGIAVVEVPLLDRFEEHPCHVDEIVYVHAPRSVRRARAIARGMDAADFDVRDDRQPSEDYLFSHADTILDNSGTPDDLARATRAWWERRRAAAG